MSDTAKSDNVKALKDSFSNSVNLNYKKHNETPTPNINRNIIWSNPPFSKIVVTNVAKRLVALP